MKFKLFIVLFVVISVPLFSQTKDSKYEAIGLTLSGGGAKGLAHIPLLKAIDSLQIPVKYVTGTSMGAIVGGLYSIGYSGKEIEEIALSINWGEILTNKISLKDIDITEKSDYANYIIEVPIDKGKAKLPSGLITGQALYNKLFELTAKSYKVQSFKKFPREYECVSTNIINGTAVALDSGNLALAIRSSMAVPSVFTPIVYDSMLLADGGMILNYPVSTCRELGAEYIIGSDVSHYENSIDSLNNIVSILIQCSQFKDLEIRPQQISLTDLYIHHDLKGYSSGDFNSTKEIIELGEKAVEANMDALIKLADEIKNSDLPKEVIEEFEPVDSVLISNIRITGLNEISETFVKGKIGFNEGEYLKIEEIEAGVRKLYGTQFFEYIYYDIIYEDGKSYLTMDFEENPEMFFKFGIHYDNDTKSSIIFNTNVKNLLVDQSKFDLKASISEYPIADLSFYRYFGKKQNFGYRYSTYYERNDFPVYEGNNQITRFKSDFISIKLDLLKLNRLNSFLAFGASYDFYNLRSSYIDALNPEERIDFRNRLENLTFNMEGVFNTTNKRFYPTQGVFMKGSAGMYFITSNKANFESNVSAFSRDSIESLLVLDPFLRINFQMRFNQPLQNNKISIYEEFRLGLTANSSENSFYAFQVGGLNDYRFFSIPFIGLRDKEYLVNQFMIGRFGLQFEVWNNFYIIPEANYMLYSSQALEDLFEHNTSDAYNNILGYGLTIGYNSILGPLNITLMNSTSSTPVQVYVNLGFIF
ncbi:patatin-like phospholipase family protein [Aureibacter tunicatorum]|uniref:NTE family protein n=1 Tax=Aureibacter tunicatorum TaxID=866807 RepID=A0AAE3XTQ8_9BACT|nr:patatin-like phospholipase family protein [Aureibacter tunicatorum]MDR6241711.1 NTE family protein [Aureibacter tunicatorum]BDD07304.1 patatin [Aureibacter tunicatorum]